MTNVRSQILRQQQGWAASRKIAFPSGYTESLDANLFQPLHCDTLAEFQRGSGDELGKNGHRGKMLALHSSSALVVNVFDYWRGRSLDWIAGALSLTSEPSLLCFEAQFPTGLPGKPPNLDLAFVLTDRRTIAVESKFTEPYAHTKQVPPFKLKYFPAGDGLWQDRALPHCQRLADRLHRGELQFLYLNAAQLLKHVLGLAQPLVGQFTLFYLWYAVPSDEARHHGEEIEAFAEEIGSELDFRVLTYQELFSSALRRLGTEHAAYLSYVGERYFPALWP
ncbi:MAG: PGN_0703 family putative restriction endonuclease [Candidatus Acidiferrales bacterium]